jgi:hypothetical protein
MSNSISDIALERIRLTLESTTPTGDPALRPGQRVAARVLELLADGQALIAIGQSRVVVRPPVPMQLGDRLVLEVVIGAPALELRIITREAAATAVPATPAAPALTVVPTPTTIAAPPTAPAPMPAPTPRTVTTPTTVPVPTAAVVAPTAVPTPAAIPTLATVPTAVETPAAAPTPMAVPVLTAVPIATALPVPAAIASAVAVPTPTTAPTPTPIAVPAATPVPIPTPAVVSPPAALPVPSLPIGTPGLPAPLSARDLPIILQALANAPTTDVPIAEAGEAFLRAAAVADLRPAVIEQIQRLLAPIEAALPLPVLAATIRTFLAQSGLFTENHLAEALNNGARVPAANQRHAVPDIRQLLGALTTAGTPVPEAVRSFGEALLQQQLAVAEGLASAGAAQVVIPFVFGATKADVVFEWERDAHDQETQDQAEGTVSLGVFVYLPALGAIEARVEWQPESLAVTFFVERAETRALVEAGLEPFSKQLALSGCANVTSNVWLNPGRAVRPPVPVKRAIPGGTILDVVA